MQKSLWPSHSNHSHVSTKAVHMNHIKSKVRNCGCAGAAHLQFMLLASMQIHMLLNIDRGIATV